MFEAGVQQLQSCNTRNLKHTLVAHCLFYIDSGAGLARAVLNFLSAGLVSQFLLTYELMLVMTQWWLWC
jgi:hypothetical protein